MEPSQNKPIILPQLYIILFSILVFSTQFQVLYSDSLSIYDLLYSYGLPKGLFPKGVKEFSFNASGNFEVYLDHPCNSKYENELHYDRNISGVLTVGKIDELSGISAKDLFLWFAVKEIRVDIPTTGLIYFDIGVVSKQFSFSSFENPKDCMAVQSRHIIKAAAHKNSYGNIRYELDGKYLGRAIL